MPYDQNTRTLIATFKDYSTAQQAAEELKDSGIDSNSVYIESSQKTASAGSTTGHSTTGAQDTGGISGWWNSLFGSDESDTADEDRVGYEGALASGSAVLRATVPASSIDTAVATLNRYGATDIDRKAAQGQTAASTGANGPIQVVEEELQVGKRAVKRGGVRVYSHVVTTPVEEQISLREEHVNVERRTVNRQIDPAAVSALQDQTIEVTEMGEEAVVGKRARVVEEVVVGKEASQRTETVRDSVRHTEVEIEEIGADSKYAGSTVGSSASISSSATGMSPQSLSAGVQSSGAGTAGAGTLAGGATAGSAITDYTSDYRKNFATAYGSGSDFESVRPAYEYGSRIAGDSRYKGKSWDQIQGTLRSDYESANPGSTWEKAKDAIQYGWNKVTGKV